MIVWVIAGLLALATGLRIGWAMVNRQSVVSSAMIVALGSLALVAALNWGPLTRLVDRVLGWPNISVALSQIALVASAAGSCVMITSVASTRSSAANRRLAAAQYGLAVLIAAVSMAVFVADGRQSEPTTQDWLVPLLYVMLVLSLVSWVGLRLSNPSRRGRALFVFTIGVALIVASVAFFLIRALFSGSANLVGFGAATALTLCALGVVAAGALLPYIEDWIGSRRELQLIEPLRRELQRRQPDIGIGVRPRGPLMFRVAERLSLISDALYLESMLAEQNGGDQRPETTPPAGTDHAGQALAVARWIKADSVAAYPGRAWLRQPAYCADRDWILEIAGQYRSLES
ncbi:MAG: hypothetical protein ACR2JM_13470 [Mycobacterium sp.]